MRACELVPPESTGSAPGPVDQSRYRRVLGSHPTGVVVITGSGPLGMSCSSLFAVSLTPPLVGFCPARSSKTWPLIRETGSFCVNILAAHQENLARQFAGDGEHRFHDVAWSEGLTHAPLLHEAVGWIECRLHSELDGGDHTIVLGEVLALDSADERSPLVFHHGSYGSVDGS